MCARRRGALDNYGHNSGTRSHGRPRIGCDLDERGIRPDGRLQSQTQLRAFDSRVAKRAEVGERRIKHVLVQKRKCKSHRVVYTCHGNRGGRTSYDELARTNMLSLSYESTSSTPSWSAASLGMDEAACSALATASVVGDGWRERESGCRRDDGLDMIERERGRAAE